MLPVSFWFLILYLAEGPDFAEVGLTRPRLRCFGGLGPLSNTPPPRTN